MHNAIYVRHRRRVLVPPADGPAPPTYVATLLANIEGFGFTASAELFTHLGSCSVEQLGRLYGEIVPALQALVGAAVAYAPIPAQVMDASRAELYLTARWHYWTLQRPSTPPAARAALPDRVELRLLELGDDADFRCICTRLLSAARSLSAADRNDVAWFFQTYGDDAMALIPERIPLRENVALLARCLLRYTPDPRVDAYIAALPAWQQAICRQVRELVHAADPEVTETIKFTNRPYFVLQGNVCALLAAKDHVNIFLYDGAIVPDPDGIITGGHRQRWSRQER